MSKEIVVFENSNIRRHYDAANEIWFFSLVDIIAALADSTNPTDYLKKMRKRDPELNAYLGTNCPQVNMLTNGKNRKILAGSAEHIFRLIQSIPSPKAEPFKQWLAKVGFERLQEMQDPSLSMDRARDNWQKMGRSDKWIQQRMTGQETRNKLTDYWKDSGVTKPDEFAFLTNIIHQEWAGVGVKEHKQMKGLKTQNIRDHMNEAELLFTALAEMSTRQIAEAEKAKGLAENAKAGKKGGSIAKNAKLELEAKTGRKVVNADNFLAPKKGLKKNK